MRRKPVHLPDQKKAQRDLRDPGPAPEHVAPRVSLMRDRARAVLASPLQNAKTFPHFHREWVEQDLAFKQGPFIKRHKGGLALAGGAVFLEGCNELMTKKTLDLNGLFFALCVAVTIYSYFDKRMSLYDPKPDKRARPAFDQLRAFVSDLEALRGRTADSEGAKAFAKAYRELSSRLQKALHEMDEQLAEKKPVRFDMSIEPVTLKDILDIDPRGDRETIANAVRGKLKIMNQVTFELKRLTA